MVPLVLYHELAMLRLFLIRHGQTLWNKELRYNGDTDTELTPLGLRQAAAVAERLRHHHLHAVVCSDRARSRGTAEPLAAGHALALHADPRWREVRFGEAEGLRWGEVVTRFPATARAWAENRPEARMPGGESLLDVAERVRPALAELADNFDNATVVVVGHGGPLRVALCLLLDVELTRHWRFNVSPGALTEVAVYPTGGVLNVLNDTCHLRGRGAGDGQSDTG